MNQPIPLHLSRYVYFMLFFLLWSLNVTAQGDLFFSEYVESKESGLGNKCLELYNPTSNSLNLSEYTIEFYNNGSTNPSTAPFTIGERVAFSKLAPFQTVVLCQPASGIGLLSVSDGTFKFGNYNGNDAIVLRYNGAIIDIIGAIGCNPGEAWASGGNSTKDNTLVRKVCIQKGNSTGDCAFAGLASEWVSLGANNFSNLGRHETGVPLVEISGNNALCENPSISLTATEGFVSYEWSNGARTNTTSINTPGSYRVTVTSDIGCTATATKTINGESPAINATISNIQAVSCIPKKDGSFTVNPSGGSGGFSYAWETGTSTNRMITGLGAGNYRVTVTDDNGCSIVQPVAIEGTVTVPLTPTVTPETCKGRRDGTITLSASGNGLTYAINNNAFQQNNRFVDLAPGDYVVQVQDNSGCGDQQSVTIPKGSNFNLRNSQIVQASCQGLGDGGQIILRPEGGQTPYQFSVDGSPFSDKRVYSNLKGGIHNIIVKDASGCEKTFQQEMEEGSDMVVDSLIISPAICEGVNDGAVQILLSGGSGNISYNKRIDGVLRPFFSPTFIGLSSGNHQIIIRDNEFDCRIPVNFEIPFFRTFTAKIQIDPLCESATTGSFSVIPQNGFAPYQYSLDSNAFVSDSLFQEVVLKNYVVTTKDYDGCTTIDSVNFEDGLSFEIVFAVPRAESCVGNEDGQITVVANGMDSVSYSIDDINYSENNVFAGLAAGDYTVYAKAGDCMATKMVTIAAAAAIRLEQVIPQIALCEGDNDGQLTIDIAGGVAPYSYQLDEGIFQDTPVFSNLTQGVYTLTVRDANQCEQVFTDIILPGPVRLDPECSVTQQVTTAGGSDGSASMIIFGGMPPYDVQLLDAGFNNMVSIDGVINFDNLSAGNYIAEVKDANDCTNTCEFTIEEPQCDFSISATQTNATCFDSLNGTIKLTIPAQNLPLTINWSDTIYNGQQNLTALASGAYSVTVTDALGCVDSTAITITKPAPLNVRIETVNTTICAQDSAELVLTGMYANYAWSNGATTATIRVSETENYQVIVEDEMGCVAVDEIAITVLTQDTIRETRFTCDAMNIGTFMTEERNENGCNNIVLRTFELARKDTTYIAATTCNPADSGMFQTFLPNIFGCDSLVITSVELLRLDTTYQTLISCNSEEVGVNETVLPNQFGCDSLLIIETILEENLLQSFHTNFTCDAMEVGLDTAFVKTIAGCDSLSITMIELARKDTIYQTLISCNSDEIGVNETVLTNQFGCDSLLIIETTLDERLLQSFNTNFTCNPMEVGLDTAFVTTNAGCDSLVIISVELLRLDTTYQTLVSCNSGEVGIREVVLTNQFGCDSLLIIETTLEENLPQSFHTNFTCNAMEVGLDTAFVKTIAGCDSLAITMIELVQKDTTYQTLISCNSDEIGVNETVLTNQFGCDSLLIIETTLDERLLQSFSTTFTCNPMEIGLDTAFVTTNAGCDSLVITTVELLRLDTTYQTLISCNSDEIGVNETILTNQFGCDSLLVIETILEENLPQSFHTTFTCNALEVGLDTAFVKTIAGCDSLSITQTISNSAPPTLLPETTCDTTAVGIDTLRLTNEFLCDSLVIITTNLNPSHTFYFTEESCNPEDTGMVIQTLVNQFGCDSIITTHTILSPVNDCDLGFAVLSDSVCWDEITGTIQIMTNDLVPSFDYYLLDDFGNDTLRSGRILDRETFLTNIPIGEYSISLVNERGVEGRQRFNIVQLPVFTINAQFSDYNGFAISCIGETDGSIEVTISEGKAPYTYLWEDGSTTKKRQSLAVGDYSVTVVDANNCTNSTTFNLAPNETLSVTVQASNTTCFGVNEIGQLMITDVANANGPVEYSLDGISFQPIGALPFVVENLPLGTYELYIQDENDCQANTNFTIPISTEKQLTLGGNQNLSLGDSLLLTPVANFEVTRFEWTSTTALACADCSMIRSLPVESGQYTLTAYDANNCSLTASVAVRLEKENRIFMPNVFSPNNDGVNDMYQIFTGKSVSRINQFQIFDYEGRLMYQVNDSAPNDSSIGWDGRFNGQKMAPAVFVVLMEVTLIDGTTKQYRETMTLIK